MELPTTTSDKDPDLLRELEEPFLSYVRHIALEACRRADRPAYTQLASELEEGFPLAGSVRRELINTIAEMVLRIGAPIIRKLDRATPDPARVRGELLRLLEDDPEVIEIVDSIATHLREDRPEGNSPSALHTAGRVAVLARAQRLCGDLRLGPRVALTDALAIHEDYEVDALADFLESVRGLPEAVQRDPAIQAYRGRLLIPWGDSAGAAFCFSQAAMQTENDEERGILYLDKFYACILADDFAEALEAYEQALALAPRACELFDSFRFTPLSIVDAGIWGVAFLCRDQLGSEVVVRALGGGALDGGIVFRIAETLCKIETDHLVKAIEWGWTDRHARSGAYTVSPFHGTDTLSELVRKQGPLKQRVALPFLQRVAETLLEIEGRRLYHRDLTPENVFVRKVDGQLLPRLIDCGLSVPGRTLVGYRTSIHESESLLSRIVAQTLHYAPPEQKGLSRGALGPTADIYYFGRLANFALFGRAEPLERHWQSVPGDVEALLMQCQAEDPAARPQSFTEVVPRLETLVGTFVSKFDPDRFKQEEKPEGASGLFAIISGLFKAAPPPDVTDGSKRTVTKAWWRPRKEQKRLVGETSWPLAVENALGMQFVLVPNGSYTRGSKEDEPGRRLNEQRQFVEIPQAFYMKATPVTRKEWLALMQTTPWFFESLDDDAPIENVTWFDAVEYCNRLSALDGLEPVYRLSDVSTDGISIKSAKVEFLGRYKKGYRLPLELEWEWACRGGVEGEAFSTGSHLTEKQAHFGTRGPVPVARFAPNPFGLYDMHGNVWEWCQDWYRYDPLDTRPPDGQRRRAKRGGSWQVPAVLCRSAFRARLEPEFSKNDLGFRPIQPVLRGVG